MNITIIGRLTAPAELRFTGSGKAVASFTLAENHRKKDAAGNWTDGTATFWDCTVWEQTAENIAEANWAKGTRVIVQGDTYTEEFTRKDGTAGKAMKVKATEVGVSVRGFGERQQPAGDPWSAPAGGDESPF